MLNALNRVCGRRSLPQASTSATETVPVAE
jgi:hypothetical protein